MTLTFWGGIHPEDSKLTKASKIKEFPVPKKVCIPLSQHIGASCKLLVKAGDKVKLGQIIADSEAFVSAPIHATISGTVLGIEKHPNNKDIECIIIEGDQKKEKEFKKTKKQSFSSKEIIQKVRNAGIVGLGGAMFPTHVKLSPPPEKKIDTVILNGCECEPFITSDHCLMLEKSDAIIQGLKLIMKAVGAKNACVGIEDNKKDAINLFRKNLSREKNIVVKKLKTKYPQGAEKNLIQAITKRIIPMGGLPMDKGVLVDNIATAYAVYEAVFLNKPLIERICTVTGNIKNPKNLKVRIGTMFSDLINFCGGMIGKEGKVIAGGPMMGIAQERDVPLVKGHNCVLVFNDKNTDKQEFHDCIKCGACIEVCPMKLMPNVLSVLGEKEKYSKMEDYYIQNS